jgi:uncharacterized protein
MMDMNLVTPLYAAIAALFYIVLTVRVIGARTKHKVILLDSGVDAVSREVRAHGNFSEYVPFIMLLMVLAELQGTHALIIHAIGAVTLIGRAFHYYGLTIAEPASIKAGKELNLRPRVIAMMSTFAALGGSAATLLIGYLIALY